jgi:hypothetical protein
MTRRGSSTTCSDAHSLATQMDRQMRTWENGAMWRKEEMRNPRVRSQGCSLIERVLYNRTCRARIEADLTIDAGISVTRYLP